MGKPFVMNRHGRMVFPSSFLGDLDFATIESAEQLSSVIHRDYEAKAPTGKEIRERAENGKYASRYDLLRDMALNLYWTNRYAMTLYEKRPTRWRDVPKKSDEVFLPLLKPWIEGEAKVAAVSAAYAALPAGFDAEAEDRIHAILFDVYRHKLHHATGLAAIKKTVGEALETPEALTYCLTDHDPDFPTFNYQEILDCHEDVPELEALMRMVMILHNAYPWNREATRLERVDSIDPDEFVVVLMPRSREAYNFIQRVKRGDPPRRRPAPPAEAVKPSEPVPPVIVSESFSIPPKLEALAVSRGEHVCTNEDVIRNTAFSWSRMSADDILDKTGIGARLYSERNLEEMALTAAESALRTAGRAPEEIAAVIFCSCTSEKLIPSVACWLSGQMGIFQTHASFDLIAACAGFPYGLAEATRILLDVKRPVLVVCAEKFSDKIGSVRPSRMIFGDGAAAMVVAPGEVGERPDIEVLQTYASGPDSQVNSIIWPNPDFDNSITVWGPEVRALVERYLEQMMGELQQTNHPHTGTTLLEDIDLVVPHQANRTMVTELATKAGMDESDLYFNIERVGNVSAASIPIAIHDAATDGVIDEPTTVFAPGFGAGAVAGYAIVRIDPAIIAPEVDDEGTQAEGAPRSPGAGDETSNVVAAFG